MVKSSSCRGQVDAPRRRGRIRRARVGRRSDVFSAPRIPPFRRTIRMRFMTKLNNAPRTLVAAAAGAIGLMVIGSAAPARADGKLPAVLSDHMVLQQQMSVPVWGTADAGEEVTVTFGQQKQTAKAGADGKWSVKLSPLQASDRPAELTVAGKNTVKLSDVLVGEVWVASGQSNMEMGIQQVKDADKEIAAADHPQLRLFTVPKGVAD